MLNHLRRIRSRKGIGIAGTLLIALALCVAVAPTDAEAGARASKVWRKIAKTLRNSVKSEAKGGYLLALARATALTDEDERDEAIDVAKEEFRDERDLAADQYKARLELAVALGEDELYTVDIDPANFVAGVDNPFFPLTPGVTLTYEAQTEDGLETIVVEVLAETKEILGVDCVVVRDTVTIDGQLVEDTHDWYAQDVLGNVWYMGEIALNYEDGELVDVDGSWQGGRDGAYPGIIMRANPAVGDIYRQEFYLGEAEDYGEVLALGEDVTVRFGTFNGCLRTLDGTPMEPDGIEHKSYAPGIGVILEVNPETGERVELIDRTTP